MASAIADSDATTGFHVESGHELDVVHGEYVGGVSHRNGEHGTNARQRDYLVAKRGVLGNQLNYVRVDFVIFKVDGRNAILPGGAHR